MKNINNFIPRLNAPSKDNIYYYSNNNPFYASGYGMPNCTAYAYGRIYEILEKAPNLSLRNAKEWFVYNKQNNIYKYGQTPKLGAVACWGEYGNSKYGHVAVVEKISSNTITVSESQYSSKVVFTTHNFTKGNYVYSWNKNFLGFIYPVDIEDDNNSDNDSSLNLIGIANSNLNLRSLPSTDSDIILTIPKGSKVNIIQSLNDWYKVRYSSYEGYAFSKYITLQEDDNDNNVVNPNQQFNPLKYPCPTRDLQYPSTPVMTGDDVRYVQTGLNRLGYSVNIDGSYGPGTKEVVIKFQKDNNLNAQGYFGKLSLDKLRNEINDPYLYPVPTRSLEYPSSPVMTGEDVKFVQYGLKYIGYNIDVDGSYGPSTKNVVIEFQKDNGLNAQGYFGSLSLDKLQQLLKK